MPFDRWYRYPAGFSRASLDLAINSVYGPTGTGLTVDPFAGAGSAGTAMLARGGTFVGLEAHPQIAELANLKFQRRGQSKYLIEAARSISSNSPAGNIRHEHELVKRCFEDNVLSEIVGLREAIAEFSPPVWRDYLKWALLATLRDVASVKVGWPYQRPALERQAPHRDPTRRFLQRVEWMAEDLAEAPAPLNSAVVCGNSTLSDTWRVGLQGAWADSSISSPPYLNNFDYADATRLELYFWGSADSWKSMCDNVRSGMLIATTQQTRKQVSLSAIEQLSTYPTLYAKLDRLIEQLSVERARRIRGKEYDRVVAPYFLGLAGVLSNLFESLRSGGRVAWLVGDSAPYGVLIDTPSLILTLASDLGFERLADTEVRTRGQRWRKNGVRHQVRLSERLIVFSRP